MIKSKQRSGRYFIKLLYEEGNLKLIMVKPRRIEINYIKSTIPESLKPTNVNIFKKVNEIQQNQDVLIRKIDELQTKLDYLTNKINQLEVSDKT